MNRGREKCYSEGQPRSSRPNCLQDPRTRSFYDGVRSNDNPSSTRRSCSAADRRHSRPILFVANSEVEESLRIIASYNIVIRNGVLMRTEKQYGSWVVYLMNLPKK